MPAASNQFPSALDDRCAQSRFPVAPTHALSPPPKPPRLYVIPLPSDPRPQSTSAQHHRPSVSSCASSRNSLSSSRITSSRALKQIRRHELLSRVILGIGILLTSIGIVTTALGIYSATTQSAAGRFYLSFGIPGGLTSVVTGVAAFKTGQELDSSRLARGFQLIASLSLLATCSLVALSVLAILQRDSNIVGAIGGAILFLSIMDSVTHVLALLLVCLDHRNWRQDTFIHIVTQQ
ncbi:unnamed protein product [Cyprideis torosa]|uniref:Uncharacterized protein n=1 Tax=Cyprideis torosa TaxID=163714 RepID=A0A7R8ZQD0_9CRUS|nr:unnamed protein product [Cyprideis torosa]CAG0891790.1 unnamed protein product [Cyprideis torosa]